MRSFRHGCGRPHPCLHYAKPGQTKTSPFIFYAIDAADTSADITSKWFGIVHAIARDKGLVVEPSLAVKLALGEVREYCSKLIERYIAEGVSPERAEAEAPEAVNWSEALRLLASSPIEIAKALCK